MSLPADLLSLLPPCQAMALARTQACRLRDPQTWSAMMVAPGRAMRHLLEYKRLLVLSLCPELGAVLGQPFMRRASTFCTLLVASTSLNKVVSATYGTGAYHNEIWTWCFGQRTYLPSAKFLAMSASGDLLLLMHVHCLALYTASGIPVATWERAVDACFIGDTVVVYNDNGMTSWSPPMYNQGTAWEAAPLNVNLTSIYSSVWSTTQHAMVDQEGVLVVRNALGQMEYTHRLGAGLYLVHLHAQGLVAVDREGGFTMDVRTGARTVIAQCSDLAFSPVWGVLARSAYPNIYIYVDFKLARTLYGAAGHSFMSWAGRSLVFCNDATAYVITV